MGNVPADAGTFCLRPSEPAIASTGTMSVNRPISIDRPSVVSYQVLVTVRPPNAEPLLLPAEAKAYTISLNPCGPWLSSPSSPNRLTIEIAENTSTAKGTNRM